MCETKPTQGSLKCEVSGVKQDRPDVEFLRLQTSHFKPYAGRLCETKPKLGEMGDFGRSPVAQACRAKQSQSFGGRVPTKSFAGEQLSPICRLCRTKPNSPAGGGRDKPRNARPRNSRQKDDLLAIAIRDGVQSYLHPHAICPPGARHIFVCLVPAEPEVPRGSRTNPSHASTDADFATARHTGRRSHRLNQGAPSRKPLPCWSMPTASVGSKWGYENWRKSL